MKKGLLLTTIACFGLAIVSMAQSKDGAPDIKYRRSSLHLILLESESFPKKDTVLAAYSNAPFPDKYDNHQIGEKSFDPKVYTVTDKDRLSSGKKKKSMMGDIGKGLLTDATAGIVDTAKADMQIKISKYFIQNNVANKLVAKWFDQKADNSFDWNLVAQRGIFNASFLESKTAQASSDGIAILKTAGLELIGNTFVVVSSFRFSSNEPTAALVRDAAKAQANKMSDATMKKLSMNAADLLYDQTKDGYSVWTTTYLYKLVWNDTVSTIFFTDYYTETSDPIKMAAFNKSNIFKLEFIGDELSSESVLFKMGRTEDKIISEATVRSFYAVLAKLQRKYDQFKPKTPLYTGDPITAKIGLKEGLEGGDKFEVLEQVLDEKTGAIKYNRKGTITVDKKLIWDNRYSLSDSPVAVAEAEGTPSMNVTTFKGGKGFYPGMLIRQIK
jgi:hypothetical protein